MSPSNNTAIVTVTIGEKARDVGKLTHPLMAGYARKIGSVFLQITEHRVHASEAKLEKFQLYDLLVKYKRIIYLDTDVIIMPQCPDLFKHVPVDRLGAFFDSEVKNNDADIPAWREEEISFFQSMYGDIDWKSTYFNSGVMVIPQEARAVFSYAQPLHAGKRVIDQTQINYNFQKLKIRGFDIGPAFNYLLALSGSKRQFDDRFKNHILHYAGYEYFYKTPPLLTRIGRDIDLISQMPFH